MADWKFRLRVGTDRAVFERGEITIQDLAHRFAVKVKTKAQFIRDVMKDEDLAEEAFDISDEFETVESVAEFDDVLARLYDWADTTLEPDSWPPKKLCWVESASDATSWKSKYTK